MDAEPFGSRLRAAVQRTGPLCAGIDPSPALLRAWDLDDSPASAAEGRPGPECEQVAPYL